ncbi:tetratricopeptide repeat protein [Spirochaeta lutea]|uniref:Restriction endonuclease n=1 Tax=Spirochaeta lutea TaxID=1480694 RepID=A0A098QVF1_9SPIO|nr:tetratricopeptide repeat protein [Spirochaeta lutea]KGE71353.1 restriction endonuclease [Spirochaeta lutea]
MIIIPLVALGLVFVLGIILIVRSILTPKRVGTIERLYKQRKFPQAIKMAKQILLKDPRNADAHYFLGLSYLEDNKPELALMELKAVNQIGKFDGLIREVPFRIKIAELYSKFNQPEEALKEYLLLLKNDPENPEYYYQSGLLFEQRGRADKAVGYYRKAISLNDRHANAHSRLGSLLFRAKRLGDAKESLEKATRLQPENAQAHYFLGKIQKEAKEYVAALASFEKSAKDSEFKTKSLIERGNCLYYTGDMDRAEAELQRAIKLSQQPGSAEIIFARYLLAAMYEQSRKIEEAIEQWETIYAVKPDYRDVGQKLSNYQDLRTDDVLKDFLIAGQEEFIQMCRGVVEGSSLAVHDVKTINGGCQIIAGESSTKWRNQRTQPRLIHFLRITDPVDESTIRDFNELIREQGVSRGLIFTSSTFTRMAQVFAENRPIELHDKETLQRLLKKYSGNS